MPCGTKCPAFLPLAGAAVGLRRSGKKLALLGKAGAVTGTFPGVFIRIPHKAAAHVGTAAVFFTNAGQKTFSRFNGMDHELHRRGSKVEA